MSSQWVSLILKFCDVILANVVNGLLGTVKTSECHELTLEISLNACKRAKYSCNL